MKKIELADLYAQHKPVRRGIIKGIKRVFKSSSFIQGSEVQKFETNLSHYLDCNHVISCASGTDALMLSLMALDLHPGDEVIIPAFTFVSALEVTALLGLKPVLVDIDGDTFCMDAERVEEAVTPRTRVIIATHLFGQCCDMTAVMETARQHGLYVIEDACQSIGSEYILKEGEGCVQMGSFTYSYHCAPRGIRRKAGTVGHIGCFSFFPSKNLGCYGDGGAVCTDMPDIAEKIRAIARHGAAQKYMHNYIGLNSRLDTVQAVVLNAHLPRLNYYNARRYNVAQEYNRHFVTCMNIKVPGRSAQSTHVYNQYCLLCRHEDERNALKFHLESMGIPTAVYYPMPLHLQEGYRWLGYMRGDFPVAESVSQRILAIPVHPWLTRRQRKYIIRAVLGFFA